MAANLFDFLTSIGSTPTPQYGTSGADVAQRQAISNAVQNFKLSPSSTINFMDGGRVDAGGPNLYPPAYAGSSQPRPVPTSTVGPIRRATAAQNQFGQAMSYFPGSGSRSVADLLAMVGSPATGADRLPQLPAPRLPPSPPAYAPWGAQSRALAFNGFNPDPSAVPSVPSLPSIGADPGMGGAMFGPKQMASSIPPQQPPADGSSPLPVWNEPQTAVATQISRGPSGSAKNGYIYVDGKRVGRTDWTAGLTPDQQYKMANIRGAFNVATQPRVGLTPVQQVQKQTGASASNAYGAANAAAAAKAAAKATKPVYQSSGGGGDWFSSVTRA